MNEKTKLKEVVRYIICFLLGEENAHLVDCVSYDAESQNSVNIVPSNFFSTDVFLTKDSLPNMLLEQVEGIPLLFGTPMICMESAKVVTHADIIASTFFLITRYEEYIRADVRDEHGRFLGRESLPYKAGFLHRPLVEEYGYFLRNLLRKAGIPAVEPLRGISKVYLTHDVDAPWEFPTFLRRCTGASKILLKSGNIPRAVQTFFRPLKKDPFWLAFDWLKEQDEPFLQDMGSAYCRIVYFLLFGGKAREDSPYAKDIRTTQTLIRRLQPTSKFGIHISYRSGMQPSGIFEETQRFQNLTGESPRWSRHHYLTCREPSDLRSLLEAGITDDFTHGYADTAGSRLGTCRPVKWIDIEKMEVTGLTLHPMTIMECTLDREEYMNLSEEAALEKCKELIDCIYQYSGEVVLLWHNTSVTANAVGYQRQLYCAVLEYLKQKRSEHIHDCSAIYFDVVSNSDRVDEDSLD